MLTAAYLTYKTTSPNLNRKSPLELFSAAFPLMKLDDGLPKWVFGVSVMYISTQARKINYHPEHLNVYL